MNKEFLNWLSKVLQTEPSQIETIVQQAEQSENGKAILEQLANAFQRGASPEEVQNALQQSQEPEAYKTGGKIDNFVQKFGKGGMSRKESRERSAVNKQYDRPTFQIATQNARRALREQRPDLHGYDFRQAKRRIVAGEPLLVKPKSLSGFNNVIQQIKPAIALTPVVPKETVVVPKETVVVVSEPISFSDAFRNARKNKLSEFEYKGKRYNTMLKEETPNKAEVFNKPETPINHKQWFARDNKNNMIEGEMVNDFVDAYNKNWEARSDRRDPNQSNYNVLIDPYTMNNITKQMPKYNTSKADGGILSAEGGKKVRRTRGTTNGVYHDIEITPQNDTIVSYSYPSYNGSAVLSHDGKQSAIEYSNYDGMFPYAKVGNVKFIKTLPWYRLGWKYDNQGIIDNVRQLIKNHANELKEK